MKRIIVVLITLIMILPISANALTELPVDVLSMSIKEIQDSVDKGYFSYEQLVSFYLDRINTYNKQYNAVISINQDAINEAKVLDQERESTGARSLLMGIPIIIKDNIDFVKLPTTAGTKALSDNYPKKNADVVQKLIDAGAIIIAKSNMSEFAFSANNSKSSYGHTYNAYNTLYSSYGSSGGTAVAVAANLAVAGLGTDTNASVRTPASANNLVGLRPTFGSISDEGVIKYDSARDTVGPITKYISDNKILLSIINNKNINYIEEYKNEEKIRIGVLSGFMKEKGTSSTPPLASTYSSIVNLMNNSINILSENYEIVYIDDFYNSYYHGLVTSSYSGTMMCYDFNQYIKNTNSKIKSFEQLISNGGYIQALSGYTTNCNIDYTKTSAYAKKVNNKNKYKDYVLNIMNINDVDVLAYPTTKNKLLKISETGVVPLQTNSYIIAPSIGFPSLNVPIGFDEEGLPYGMEILARANEEKIIYNVAEFFESKTNYYKNPDIAPNLYNLPSEIDILIANYETLNSKKFNEVKEETKNFFINYNTIQDKEEQITLLNNKYEEVKNTPDVVAFIFDNEISHNIMYILVPYVCISFIYLILVKIFNKNFIKNLFMVLGILLLIIIILIIR